MRRRTHVKGIRRRCRRPADDTPILISYGVDFFILLKTIFFFLCLFALVTRWVLSRSARLPAEHLGILVAPARDATLCANWLSTFSTIFNSGILVPTFCPSVVMIFTDHVVAAATLDRAFLTVLAVLVTMDARIDAVLTEELLTNTRGALRGAPYTDYLFTGVAFADPLGFRCAPGACDS